MRIDVSTGLDERSIAETSRADIAGAKVDAVGARAIAIAAAGGLAEALETGGLPAVLELSLSEALILGLLKQGVRKYLAIFGHGSTDLGEILRIYDEAGVTQTFNFRNEVEMAHAATALAWQYGETPAVVTSIGPGGLQAMAGSLAAASNGIGVYHIYGDETTYGEGYNMQQVPKQEQALYGRITAMMGQSYVLHTPEALRDALRRGALCVNHPYKAGPFFLLAPINTQPRTARVNLAALPDRPEPIPVAPVGEQQFEAATSLINKTAKVAIKAGGGTRGMDEAVRRLVKAAGAVAVLSPGSTGVLPDSDPANMHVGGSKGSISGNFAMREAEVVVVIGSRAVCQADCSGIGFANARHVVNINGDVTDAQHYNRTIALTGDVEAIAHRLAGAIENLAPERTSQKSEWLQQCAAKKDEWARFKQEHFDAMPIQDDVWKSPVLTQPAAIKIVSDFAKSIDAAKLFDAGDVQANGFQIVEDERTGDTFTESGASYMGFAVSGLLAGAVADTPRYTIAFTGDGSFMMNPQVLIDAVEHGLHGMIVIFDNRRMAAISSLQRAQYGRDFKTNDSVAVDYVRLAGSVEGVLPIWAGTTRDELKQALVKAHAHPGLSVVHVPVYGGDDPIAGLGSWGSWNVGNWVDDVQSRWLAQDI